MATMSTAQARVVRKICSVMLRIVCGVRGSELKVLEV